MCGEIALLGQTSCSTGLLVSGTALLQAPDVVSVYQLRPGLMLSKARSEACADMMQVPLSCPVAPQRPTSTLSPLCRLLLHRCCLSPFTNTLEQSTLLCHLLRRCLCYLMQGYGW